MSFVLVTVRKMANMWHVCASDQKGPVEKIVSRDGAVQWAKGIYAASEMRPIELLVFDQEDEVAEAWAIRDGIARDLNLILPQKN